MSAVVLLLVGVVVYSNVDEQKAIDRSTLPEKVENSKGFQKWITNAKNKGVNIEADEFVLFEENEVFNSTWVNIYSIDEPGRKGEYEKMLADVQDVDEVSFSPSKRLYVDYRFIDRNGYKAGEVHLYGLRDDKIIDARALECKNDANCFFDRAFFLDNDVFVVSEYSLAEDFDTCQLNEICTYTVKLHVTDLKNNQRLIYESKEKELNLEELMPEI